MNPKIIVVGVVAAFVIIIGIIGFSGSVVLDDIVSKGNTMSPSETPREILPLEVELVHITILEVTDRAATVEVEFKVTNPNMKSVILQLINYELYENDLRIKISQIGQRPIGMVDSSNYFTILSGSPTILRDTITIQNTGNTPELWDSLENNTPNWKIKGEASFNLSSITAGGEKEIRFEFHKNNE